MMISKRLSLAAIALLSLSAPALAGPGSCPGRAADEAAGQRVLVRLKVDEAGTITGREAEWEFSPPGAPTVDGMSVKLGYVAPQGEALGPVTSVSAFYIGRRGGVSLDGARAVLETGSGKRWSALVQSMFSMGLAQLGVKTPWGGLRNPDLVEAIGAETQATVTLLDKKAKPFATLTLHPADTQVRDRLMAAAMAEARQRAAAPAPCQ